MITAVRFFILILPDGVAFLTLSSLGPRHVSIQFYVFPFQRVSDPLDVWSTNLIETISRNLNGTDCVTICWGGKRREKRLV